MSPFTFFSRVCLFVCFSLHLPEFQHINSKHTQTAVCLASFRGSFCHSELCEVPPSDQAAKAGLGMHTHPPCQTPCHASPPKRQKRPFHRNFRLRMGCKTEHVLMAIKTHSYAQKNTPLWASHPGMAAKKARPIKARGRSTGGCGRCFQSPGNDCPNAGQ